LAQIQTIRTNADNRNILLEAKKSYVALGFALVCEHTAIHRHFEVHAQRCPSRCTRVGDRQIVAHAIEPTNSSQKPVHKSRARLHIERPNDERPCFKIVASITNFVYRRPKRRAITAVIQECGRVSFEPMSSNGFHVQVAVPQSQFYEFPASSFARPQTYFERPKLVILADAIVKVAEPDDVSEVTDSFSDSRYIYVPLRRNM
jgi:hypothetical protein